MEKKRKTRILKSENILPAFLSKGSSFRIGITLEDFLKCPNLTKYGLPQNATPGQLFTPAPKGSVTKANLHGKYVRRQPEVKIDKKVHIKYVRKDGTRVEFDRIFHVYAKELLHQYNIGLELLENPNGQKIVVSPLLVFDNQYPTNMKNTHVINVFCEVFNTFEVIKDNLEFAIPFNKQFENELLPQGKLGEGRNFEELAEIADRIVRNDDKRRAFKERLSIIKEYNPDILGKGPNGFFGYIVFGFIQSNIVILESMYSGNATYVFDAKDYEQKVIKDKQEVLNNHLAKRRFFHHDKWEAKIRVFLSKLVK